jgi:prolipoprotein diacylglyceryltransferase
VPDGVLGISYLVLYCISQLVVFFWRTDYETPVIWLGLRQAQLTAIAVLLLVVPPVIYFWSRSNRHRSRDRLQPAQSLGGWR